MITSTLFSSFSTSRAELCEKLIFENRHHGDCFFRYSWKASTAVDNLAETVRKLIRRRCRAVFFFSCTVLS